MVAESFDRFEQLRTEIDRIATLAEQAAAELAPLVSQPAEQVRRAYAGVAVGLRNALKATTPTQEAAE